MIGFGILWISFFFCSLCIYYDENHIFRNQLPTTSNKTEEEQPCPEPIDYKNSNIAEDKIQKEGDVDDKNSNIAEDKIQIEGNALNNKDDAVSLSDSDDVMYKEYKEPVFVSKIIIHNNWYNITPQIH